jgi:hypothetical protein
MSNFDAHLDKYLDNLPDPLPINESGLTYNQQCAKVLLSTLKPMHRLRKEAAAWAKTNGPATLSVLNQYTRNIPALATGEEVPLGKSSFPRTFKNLVRYKDRSALGRLFLLARYQVIYASGPPCIFIRARGTRRWKTGKYAGKCIGENYVLHQYNRAGRTDLENILFRFEFPELGIVLVEKRSTFAKLFAIQWDDYG